MPRVCVRNRLELCWGRGGGWRGEENEREKVCERYQESIVADPRCDLGQIRLVNTATNLCLKVLLLVSMVEPPQPSSTRNFNFVAQSPTAALEIC